MPRPEGAAVPVRFVEEVLNGHNLDVIPDLVSDDFVEENPPPGQGPGRDGLRDFLGQLFTAFPDLEWTVEQMVADGEAVMAWSTWKGTHRDAFLGIPPTGTRVTVEAWTRDVVHDGRIVSSRILMDNLALLQQLGAIPAVAS
ncbi:hypothetical protein GCM10009868_34080 [Terrabacter aerolatus]|uniref:Ester cyclase n=1 Tax=Terrabacter aerolatus TaxID=422442 RepID=A0A512CWK5_9MICO|nr:ester cyclase [Terrabacter aerolatus]GEO28608.1 hypothetical protein TAE01_04180 [Terrabacter aerolatus]